MGEKKSVVNTNELVNDKRFFFLPLSFDYFFFLCAVLYMYTLLEDTNRHTDRTNIVKVFFSLFFVLLRTDKRDSHMFAMDMIVCRHA